MELVKPAPSRSLDFPVRLRAEDLTEILDLITSTTDKPGDLVIGAGGYKLESLSELAEMKEDRIHYLNIFNYKRGVSLEIDADAVRIRGSSADPLIVAAVDQIARIAQKRKRRVRAFLQRMHLAAWFLGSALGLVLIRATDARVGQSTWSLYTIGVLLLLALASFVVGLLLLSHNKRSTTIILRAGEDAKSFWKRNKDEVLVGVIVGIAVAVLTLPLGYLIGKLSK